MGDTVISSTRYLTSLWPCIKAGKVQHKLYKKGSDTHQVTATMHNTEYKNVKNDNMQNKQRTKE